MECQSNGDEKNTIILISNIQNVTQLTQNFQKRFLKECKNGPEALKRFQNIFKTFGTFLQRLEKCCVSFVQGSLKNKQLSSFTGI